MKLGFFSLITPEYSVEEILEPAKRWGFEGIEWRIAAPGQPRVGDVNFWTGSRCSIDPARLHEELPRVVQQAHAAGLASPSICPYSTCGDLKELDRIFGIAAESGVKLVRVSADRYDRTRSYNEQFETMRRGAAQVAALAHRHGVRACMLQHARTLVPSASACRRLVDGLDPRDFGLYLDVGHFVCEGYEDFGIVVDLLRDYIAEIHLRNGWLDSEGQSESGFTAHTPRWGALDRGNVNLGLLAETLGAANWNGWLMLEDFSARPTEQRMTEGIAVMHRMVALAATRTPAATATPAATVTLPL